MNISSVAQSYVTHSHAPRPERDEAHQAQDSQAQDTKAQPEKDANLSAEELKEVEKLKARDREVRAHEMAHLAAAGGLATSGASFTYQRGPDGARYAVGGEVQIDTSRGSTHEETIRKAQTIRSAALAPAEPSGQDRAVAAKATQMEAQAKAELAAQDREEQTGDDGGQEQSAEDAAFTTKHQQTAVQQYQSVASYAGGSAFELQA